MTRSSSNRMNRNARTVARRIGRFASINWQKVNGQAFTEVSARVFAEAFSQSSQLGIDPRETSWLLVAELLNRAMPRGPKVSVPRAVKLHALAANVAETYAMEEW